MTPSEHKQDTIAFIGGGNMARSLIGGLLAAGAAPRSVLVIEPNSDTGAALAKQFGVTVLAAGDQQLATADVVVLAVKPQLVPQVCEGLAALLPAPGPLFMSVAAGITTSQLDRWLGGGRAVVRVMPNTPALLGAGASGLFANAAVADPQRASAEQIMQSAGLVRWIDDEALMDTVTGLSGSGPAYFFAFVEALEDAAAAQGLDRETARDLACQTCLGAGRMLTESGETPTRLREQVTSPGGTTAAGLASLADSDLPGIVARAVAAATQRGGELSAAND